MTETYSKKFYLDTYKKILKKDKSLLFNDPKVTKSYVYDNTRYFKNALDEYFKYNKVYNTKNIPIKYRKVKGEDKPETRLGNNRFYTILSILENYDKNINKCNTTETKENIFNLTDLEIEYYKKDIIRLYERLSVIQQPVHDTKYENLEDELTKYENPHNIELEISGIPTKDSSDEETNINIKTMEVISDSSEDSEGEEDQHEEDEDLEQAMLEDKQLLVLKHLSKEKNIDFEELIKTEMPEFYKRENEKGRIIPTIKYYESV